MLKAGQTFETTGMNPALAVMFRKSVQPYLISWIKLNPQIEIAKLQIPILIINGDKDLQIQVADAQLLQIAKSTATLEIISNMNHVFKIINGDASQNMASYRDETLPVSGILVEKIVLFLSKIK